LAIAHHVLESLVSQTEIVYDPLTKLLGIFYGNTFCNVGYSIFRHLAYQY